MCCFLLLAFVSSVLAQIAIWPQPLHITTGSESTWLGKDLTVLCTCEDRDILKYSEEPDLVQFVKQDSAGNSASLQDEVNGHSFILDHPIDENLIVQQAVRRATNSLFKTNFVPWKFYSRNSDFEPQKLSVLRALVINQSRCPSSTQSEPRDFFEADESYKLEVTKDEVIIQSNSTLGTLRALETIKQIVYRSQEGGVYVPHIPIQIEDRPKWPHRGLSLDIARNVIGVKEVLKTMDAMATAKFSRLHLHATDSQSWPLEIPSMPDLASKGAYRKEHIWTSKDLADVQRYGMERGISVFIEIDSPGHTASIHHAYPDLIAAYNELDWDTFAAEPLSGQLKLDSPKVKDFIDTLLGDLLPRVSKFTQLYHIGGDEVNKNVHLLDETVKSNSFKILHPLLQRFISSMINHALLHGLQPVVWEEMVLDWNLTLPRSSGIRSRTDTLVQVWRDSERIVEVLKRGHRVIFGDHKHWYLDCGFGIGFLDPYPEGASPSGVPYNTSGGFPSRLKPPYLDYCNPFHNWRDMFVYNPVSEIEPQLHHLIEGGEVLMWSEQTDSVDLDFKLWPRAAAAAEVLWSGPRTESMLQNASKRLGQWRERAVLDLGVRSSPVHMTWCLMEGGCNL